MKCKPGIIILCSMLLFAAGCSAPKKVMTLKFDADAHQEYTNKGKYTITGQALLQRRGAGLVNCSGHEITLAPNTAFFREMVDVYKNVRFPDVDPSQYSNYYRKAACNEQGEFVFENVPSLPWFVASDAAWFSGETPGALLLKKVDVTRDQKILLSDGDFVTYIGE